MKKYKVVASNYPKESKKSEGDKYIKVLAKSEEEAVRKVAKKISRAFYRVEGTEE